MKTEMDMDVVLDIDMDMDMYIVTGKQIGRAHV